MFLDLYGKYRISVISFSTNLMYLLPRLLPNIVLEMCCCVHLFQRTPGSPSSPLSPSSKISIKDEADQVWTASYKSPPSSPSRSTNLHRAGSIQNLISKFSGPDQVFSSGYSHLPKPGRLTKAYSVEVLDSPTSPLTPCSPDQVPNITVTPPPQGTSQSQPESAQDKSKTSQIAARIDCPEGGNSEKADLKERKSKTQIFDFGRDSVGDSGLGSVSKKKKSLTYRFDVIAWAKTLHHQHGTAGFWNAWWGTVIGVHETRFQWQDSTECVLQSSQSDFRFIQGLKSVLFWLFWCKSPMQCCTKVIQQPMKSQLIVRGRTGSVNESACLHVEVQLSLLDSLTTCVFFTSPVKFFLHPLKM